MNRRHRKLNLLASTAFSIATIGANAHALEDDSPPVLSDDDLFILQMRLGRYMLSDGLIGYRVEGGACVLLEDFVRAVEFAINVDETGARGWFVRPEQTFVLNLEKGRVEASGRARALRKHEVIDDGGAPCVLVASLAEWFPVDLSLDFENAIIFAKSRSPLPVEEREVRKRRRLAIVERSSINLQSKDIQSAPYAMARWPIIDSSLSATITQNGVSASGDILMAAEIAKVNTELYVNVNAHSGVQSIRARAGRRNAKGGLGGPLDATEMIAGDVAAPQNRLSAGSKTGRGVFISSYDLDKPDIFDTTTLRGEILSGWEVELYRNDVLLGFRSASPDGRYEFLEVPVLYGRNRFRLVFYGPQGQMREESKEFFVGDSLLNPGKHKYFLAINQQETSTIYNRTPSVNRDSGRLRAQGRFELGVTKKATIAVGAATYHLNGERQSYVDASVKTSLAGLGVIANTSWRNGGGSALSTSFFMGRKRFNLIATHEEFWRYDSELVRGTGEGGLRRRDNVRLDFMIDPVLLNAVPIAINGRHEERNDGARRIEAAIRSSINVSGLSISNEITGAHHQQPGNNDSLELAGTALFNRPFPGGVLRGEIGYDIKPTKRFNNLGLTSDIHLAQNASMRINASYNAQDGVYNGGAGLNFAFSGLSIGAFGRISSDGAFETGVNLSSSLARNPISGKWSASASDAAASGAIAARIFVDNDGDGAYTQGDDWLEEARLKIDGRPIKTPTTSEGGLLITGLAPYEPVSVELDMRTVEDPYLIGPKISTKYIAPRPGLISEIHIPLSRSGEIVGETLLLEAGAKKGVGDVQLELVDESGAVIATTRSEYDGFYVFERTPFGNYTVRISPEQAERLNLRQEETPALTLTIDNDIAEGVVITLSPYGRVDL